MGCVASKKAVTVTPLFDRASRRDLEGSTAVPANSLLDRRRAREVGESGKASSKSSSRSYRLGNLHSYIEGEQVAAGWPAWLSAVAKEAVHGWVPLRAESYEKLDKIGQGTYSNVFRARHLETGKIVALKKVRFDNYDPESVRFMAREILILRRLDHPNIVKLEGLITSRVSSSIYLVFDYMEHDLAGLTSSPEIRFTESQIKCYMKQLLSGLEHCHLRGVMHRDIKCANLLVNNQGIIKLADFGLANFFDPGHKQQLTSRVVTLWYRPPELLLGSTDYEAAVDLWSVGCVFAEMFLKKPVFQGRTEVEQIHKIFKLCGSPPEEYWKKAILPHATLFKPQQPYVNRLRDSFKCLPESAFILLETFLSIEPYKRGTASTALASQYFKAKPYECEPTSLPKYPPKKELDAAANEDLHRKRTASRGHGLEATRPSGDCRAREPNGPSKLAAHPEDSMARNHGVNKISVKQDLSKQNGDSKQFINLQPMPAINPSDEDQQLKHVSQKPAPSSAPLPVSTSSGFAYAERQKDDHPNIKANNRSCSRSHYSDVSEPSNVLQDKNNYDFKGPANGYGAHVAGDHKVCKQSEMTNQVALKHRGNIEHPGSFDAFVFDSQDLTVPFYKRDTISSKRGSLGFQDKEDRVEFSGPLLCQKQKVDELLERHERQIRHAVRRSWFQRGKK